MDKQDKIDIDVWVQQRKIDARLLRPHSRNLFLSRIKKFAFWIDITERHRPRADEEWFEAFRKWTLTRKGNDDGHHDDHSRKNLSITR